MRLSYSIKLGAILLTMLTGVSACSMVGASQAELTTTPVPTSSISGDTVIPAQMCLMGQQDMIRSEQPQGDLVAWSPTTDTLAFVASNTESSWNVGDLIMLSAPQFDSPHRLASQVAGELTWSPDATSIAYLGLRHSDNLYTIGLAYPDGRTSRDLFPDQAAKTDDYSSQKSILEWMDSGRLRVMVSCGLNCLQQYDIGVGSGLATAVADPMEKMWGMWTPHTYHPSILPEEYADLKGQLNWAWDDRHIAYIDGKNNLWVVNADSGTLYPLDIGTYGSATETDWSFDSQYLAVQVDQYLKIFSFHCP